MGSGFLSGPDYKGKLSLEFIDTDTEEEFLTNYREYNLLYTRYAIIAGIIIYGSFGLIDPTIADEMIYYYRLIRYTIVCPSGFLIFVLSFNRRYKKYLPEMFTAVIALAGAGVVVMSRLGVQPESYLYDSGILLVLMFGCILGRLRLVHTIMVCGSTLLAYEIVAGVAMETPFIFFLHGNFNIISASFIGIGGNYFLEKYARDNFLQQKIIETMAKTDPLTKLFNRRELEARLKDAINMKKRYDVETSIIFLDIDKFKLINDNYGHRIGDELLIRLADEIKGQLREVDIAARIGGDEFCILLPNAEKETAVIITKRILDSLGSIEIKNLVILFGFSAGCATVKKDDSIASVIERADDNLYKAKKEGRGRVCS